MSPHEAHNSPMQPLQGGNASPTLLLSSSRREVRLWDVMAMDGGPACGWDDCRGGHFNHAGTVVAAVSSRQSRCVWQSAACRFLRKPDRLLCQFACSTTSIEGNCYGLPSVTAALTWSEFSTLAFLQPHLCTSMACIPGAGRRSCSIWRVAAWYAPWPTTRAAEQQAPSERSGITATWRRSRPAMSCCCGATRCGTRGLRGGYTASTNSRTSAEASSTQPVR